MNFHYALIYRVLTRQAVVYVHFIANRNRIDINTWKRTISLKKRGEYITGVKGVGFTRCQRVNVCFMGWKETERRGEWERKERKRKEEEGERGKLSYKEEKSGK